MQVYNYKSILHRKKSVMTWKNLHPLFEGTPRKSLRVPFKPFQTIVLWLSKGFSGGRPQLGPRDCRDTPASRTRQIADVFSVFAVRIKLQLFSCDLLLHKRHISIWFIIAYMFGFYFIYFYMIYYSHLFLVVIRHTNIM